jgi:hypothetical protein
MVIEELLILAFMAVWVLIGRKLGMKGTVAAALAIGGFLSGYAVTKLLLLV